MQHPKPRSDGWTARRQLLFLDVLARTGSVTRAAKAVRMSRESAYRVRSREPHGLFAAAWDRAKDAGRPLAPRAPKLTKFTDFSSAANRIRRGASSFQARGTVNL